MTSSKIKLKVTLSSATINTFVWWGNSDPIDVEDAFEDAVAAVSYKLKGQQCGQ